MNSRHEGLKKIILVALFLACGPQQATVGAGEEIDDSQDRIVGGTTDNGHPAVGVIVLDLKNVISSGKSACTGTLISPTVMVSAAHCIFVKDGYGLGLDITGAKAFFGTNADAAAASDFVAIKEWHGHPKYSSTSRVGDPNDVAVFILQASQSTTPMAWSRTAMDASSVGKAVTSVGFGKTKASDPFALGIKRRVTTSVKEVASDGAHFSYGAAGSTTCQGDSGGPELMDVNGVETLMGVTSYGPVPCESGAGTAVRLDAHRSFLEGYLGGTGGGSGNPGTGGGGGNPGTGGGGGNPGTGGGGGNPGTGGGGGNPGTGGGSGSTFPCCVGSACYTCPSKTAQTQCLGFDVNGCLASCGNDVNCTFQCLGRAAPSDPSGCTRN